MTDKINAGLANPALKRYEAEQQAKGTKKDVPNIDPERFYGNIDYTELPSVNVLEKVYIPTWNNKPADVPAVLKLRGCSILTHQNSSGIIANPGSGKSSIMEAIIASYLNPGCDALGFEVDPNCRGVIYIDNERTNTDVWNSYYRMCRRAGIPEGATTNNILIAGLRSIPRLAERMTVIEKLVEDNPCSLLLIDGAGDLVSDTNDLAQAIESRIWIREMTVKYNLSIVTTLHPNPNSNKPRGHQGSEICREAECVLLVKSGEGDTRIITSDFEHGKNRNNPKLSTAFTWSENSKMFITADLDQIKEAKQNAKDTLKRDQAQKLAQQVIPAPNSMTYTELKSAIMRKTSKGDSTARKVIQDWDGWGIIHKRPDDRYQLTL
ncbi:ATP-binding protein [Flavihumibacter sediminis]|nr:ATP-binding protein [Flavihumibacter sediminis]